MVTYTELALLRTRWTEEKARNHPQVTWVQDVPHVDGKRLVLQGEDKAALIEPVYQQCDPRLSVEALYDRVNEHYVNITKRDIRTYLRTVHPESRRKPYASERHCSCLCCHGQRAEEQQEAGR